MEKQFFFDSKNLESSLKTFAEKGITEFTLQDEKILSDKEKLCEFLKSVKKIIPDLFLILPINAKILDIQICKLLGELYCSLEIEFDGTSKDGIYLFDKKFYSKRMQTLNTNGLVFGFQMNFANLGGDKIKLFFDRLDFAFSLYPNHIDFPQIQNNSDGKKQTFSKDFKEPKNSRTFSSQDIERAKKVCYACEFFYTYGRSVTWFLSVLKPLKIAPSVFFEDFWEWQELNHYDIKKNWNSLIENHLQIQKIQLEFLKFKYEEKNKLQLFEVVKNIVELNGAMSRCYSDGEESIVEMSYNPEEILSEQAMNIQSFFENSFMEISRIKVFMNKDGDCDFHYC